MDRALRIESPANLECPARLLRRRGDGIQRRRHWADAEGDRTDLSTELGEISPLSTSAIQSPGSSPIRCAPSALQVSSSWRSASMVGAEQATTV